MVLLVWTIRNTYRYVYVYVKKKPPGHRSVVTGIKKKKHTK